MVSIRGKYGDFTHDFKISTVISPVSVRDFTCVGPLAWVVGVGVADRGLCGILDLATSISGAEHRLVNAT